MNFSLVLGYVPSRFWLFWGQQTFDYNDCKCPDMKYQRANHQSFECPDCVPLV